MRIKQELATLNNTDIYSLLLFALYKILNVKEYLAISQLMYVLDKNSFLNLCEYFGGLTIKIPTIDELENLTYLLLMYQSINIEGKDTEDLKKLLGISSKKLSRVSDTYVNLCEVLKNYEFEK